MPDRSTPDKIICDKCGYENETQRIFCHECGARLDRSAYLKAVEKRRTQEAGDTPKRMKELNRKPLWLVLRPWFIVLLGPPVVALFLMLFMDPRKPAEDVPFSVQDAAMTLDIQFDEATFAQQTVRLPVPEAVMNAQLAKRIKPDDGDSFWEKSLQWAVVEFEGEGATLTAKRKFFVIPMSFTATFTFENTGEGVIPKVTEGKIGTVPVPAVLYSNSGFWFGDVIDAARINENQLKKIRQVKVQDDQMQLTIHGG